MPTNNFKLQTSNLKPRLPRAAVLAGGASTRFGMNKALADVGGRTLTAFIVDRLLAVFAQVSVVAREPEILGVPEDARVRLIREEHTTHAALVGLCTALRYTDRALCYVTGCDMPGIVPAVIRALYCAAHGHDAALRCAADGSLQPLGGFYARRSLPILERRLAAGQFRLRDLPNELDICALPYDRLHTLDPEDLSFRNINTPEDLPLLPAGGSNT